jgi:hypothetical protein
LVTPLTESGARMRQLAMERRWAGSSTAGGRRVVMRSNAAVVSRGEIDPRPRPHLVPRERRERLVRVDQLGSERAVWAESSDATADGLDAVRGILLGAAAGLGLWIAFALGVRALWHWLAA